MRNSVLGSYGIAVLRFSIPQHLNTVTPSCQSLNTPTVAEMRKPLNWTPLSLENK